MFEERPIDGNLDRAAKCRFSNPTALERMFSESVLAVRFILHAPPQGPDFNFCRWGVGSQRQRLPPLGLYLVGYKCRQRSHTIHLLLAQLPTNPNESSLPDR